MVLAAGMERIMLTTQIDIWLRKSSSTSLCAFKSYAQKPLESPSIVDPSYYYIFFSKPTLERVNAT